jgi:hypothetical protein
LEAFPAKHRTSLGWPEGNCCVFPALRTSGFRFRSHRCVSAAATAFSPLCLAGFTSFWLVLKAFVGEKHLFTGSKYKLGAALRTLQHPIVEFHEPLPLSPIRAGSAGLFCTAGLDVTVDL